MKKITLFIFFFPFFVAYSQSWLPNQHDTLLDKKHEIIFSGTADYQSTSLHKSLTQKLFYGGEITVGIKEKSLKLHEGINRFGSDLNAEIEYRNYTTNLFKKTNWGFVVKAGYFSFINALYSKDLFELAFYGNQNYLGDTAVLSGTKFSGLTYQKLGFGWLDKKSKSSVSLNFYSLNNYTSANLRMAEIYQSSNIDTLVFSYDGSAQFSNSPNFFSGLGVGIDADLRFSIPTKNAPPMYYQFLAKNIGVASFNAPLTNYTADTSITFTGLTFNQVLNGSSFLDSNYSALDTIGIQKSQSKPVFFLPGFLQFSKLVDANSSRKLQEFYGVRLFLASAYTPLVFAGADYRISLGVKTNVNIGINASYGGFSRFRFGTYSSIKIKNWNLGIASENLFGKTGQSILFRLQCAY
jgi:hypothetical protein